MTSGNNNKKRKLNKHGEERDLKYDTVTATLKDTVNINQLRHATFLRRDPETESGIEFFYNLRKIRPGKRCYVNYAPKGWNKMGREYNTEGSGISYISSFDRKFICGDLYHDVDFNNCGPTLFLHICKTTLNEEPPVLSLYVNNRDSIIKDIMNSRGLSRDQVKTMFITILQKGRHNTYENLVKLCIDPSSFEPIDFMVELEGELNILCIKLRLHEKYKPLYEEIKENPDKDNEDGSFLAVMWQRLERKCLGFLKDFFEREGYNVGVLLYDGIFVDKKKIGYDEKLPIQLLRNAEEYIYKKTNGIRIGISEKMMKPDKEDIDRWWGDIVYERIGDPFERSIYILVKEGKKRLAKRMGGFVMVPHKTIPGVYVQCEEHDEFINKALLPYVELSTVSRKQLFDWFLQTDHPIFELLNENKMSRDHISFKNGCFYLETLQFKKWENIETIPITDHFFDIDFPQQFNNTKTPLWDTLIKTQLEDKEQHEEDEDPNGSMYDMFECLIGRLFYDVGKYDRWQVHLFLKGDANTGKSTICNLTKKMFPLHQVGSFGKELKFGLEALWMKRLICDEDTPQDLCSMLSKTDYQSMASGESINVARKHKMAKLVQNWNVPLMFAANYYLNYKDEGGSVSRRTAVFLWNKFIKVRDTDLDRKIIKNELVNVMLRCIYKYRKKCDDYIGKEFKLVIPEKLKKDMEGIREKINPMADFIENGSERVQIIYKLNEKTDKKVLQRHYANFIMRKYKGHSSKMSDDYHILKLKGMFPVIEKVCKVCKRNASKEVCGDHWHSGKNRRNRESFMNMSIIEKEDSPNNPQYNNGYRRQY